MLLKKTVIISFVVFSLNLPVLITAKEAPLSANKNTETNTATKLLAKKTDQYELSGGANSSEQGFPQKKSTLTSLAGFEEIVTKVDSGRVIVLYPTISIAVDSYQNYFEAGPKVQRILQELLPLNIF